MRLAAKVVPYRPKDFCQCPLSHRLMTCHRTTLRLRGQSVVLACAKDDVSYEGGPRVLPSSGRHPTMVPKYGTASTQHLWGSSMEPVYQFG